MSIRGRISLAVSTHVSLLRPGDEVYAAQLVRDNLGSDPVPLDPEYVSSYLRKLMMMGELERPVQIDSRLVYKKK